ncbi:Gfo/Idh/MocA family protein [Chitinophaga flava]|uniref:Gfo/Idh/MocA-like oxidoreductase N-terminal domain-containing protein n=1 Tax=Chitinophaga flava TaxID=2259036 RepID=A0A365XTD7_9BACT|nr:Gfo/Idh/MocA family oxidoreductase [Chitinophaga flava]RBL89636.1 hypothetical protein DF182_24350 [Chitinophaga flava]
MKEPIRLILVGIGPHSKRVYLPAVTDLKKRYPVEISLAIDVKAEASNVEQHFEKNGYQIPTLFIDPFADELPTTLKATLDNFVTANKINAVIIATEPTVHKAYAEWALGLGLHILMDKPVTTRNHAISDLAHARGILDDYLHLLKMYNELQQRKSTVFTVNVQRRYHPGFQLAMERIREVAVATNCPVTNIQSTHCDGQWRLPSEIVTQDYHPYNKGYGKISHSGYHIFDIVCQLFRAPGIASKLPDSMEVISSMVQPRGFLKQLTEADYVNYFDKDYGNVRQYSHHELQKLYKDYGEMDAAMIIRLLKEEENIANITINLLHNSFARRNWIMPGSDLYKGNGRVKHEYHHIQQGPFQNIQIHSYQAKDKHHQNNAEDYLVGGNNHFDIYIFRNIGVLGGEKPLEVINMKDIALRHHLDDSKLLTEQSKTAVVKEFLDFILGNIPKTQLVSNINTHLDSVKMMSAAYMSHVQRKEHLRV